MAQQNTNNIHKLAKDNLGPNVHFFCDLNRRLYGHESGNILQCSNFLDVFGWSKGFEWLRLTIPFISVGDFKLLVVLYNHTIKPEQ